MSQLDHQKPYDVYLLCKVTDASGRLTVDDAVMGEFFDTLTQSGLNVYYVGKTPDANAEQALAQMKLLLIFAARPEHLLDAEVKEVWEKALPIVRGSNREKVLILTYKGFTSDKIPKELAGFRPIELTKREVLQNVARDVQRFVASVAPAQPASATEPKEADAKSAKETAPASPAEPAKENAPASPAEPAKKTAPDSKSANAPDVTPQLRQAFKLLSESKWGSANEVADKALSLDPGCSKAYVIKLLASLKMRTVAELSRANVSLAKSHNYVKALECASPEERAELEKIQQTVLERVTQAQYEQAVAHIKARKFEEAIPLLTELKDYKDSAELLARCTEIHENAAKESLYKKALAHAAAKGATPEHWNKSIAALKSISGYKDADAQVVALEARIEKWNQEKKEAEEQAKAKAEQERLALIAKTEEKYRKFQKKQKFFKTASLILTIVLAVYVGLSFLTVKLIVPTIRMDNANQMLMEKDLQAARDEYAALDGFDLSAKRVVVIDAIMLFENSSNDVNNEKAFEQAINKLLNNGVTVELTYEFDPDVEVKWANSGKQFGNVLVGNEFVPLQTLSEAATVFTYTTPEEFSGLATPVRTGYEFDNWDFAGKWEYDIASSEDPVLKLTLINDWSDPTEYGIEYDYACNDYELPDTNPGGYNITSSTITLTNPTRVGYTFVGWTGTDLSEPAMEVQIKNGSVGDRAYTANWEANSYTLSFASNGGSACDPLTVTYDHDFEMPLPTRTGYSFAGWYLVTGDDEMVEYRNGIWQDVSDVTLIAMWKANDYLVTFIDIQEFNGYYTYALGETHTISVTYDSLVELTVPSKAGYTFMGYYLQDQADVRVESGVWNYATDIVLTALWEAQTHTITLDANGGQGVPPTIGATYDQPYTLPTPTRLGYTFDGWYSEGRPYTGGVWKDLGDVTLSAEWIINIYDIDYVMDGGTHSNRSTYTIEDILTLQQPTKMGYTFLGWTYEGHDEPQKEVTIPSGTVGRLVFTAHWQANEYQLTLNANGGTGISSGMTVTYDDTFTLPTPTRTGYTFVGWYNGSTLYTDGTWEHAGNLTLIASWRANTYKVTLEDIQAVGADVTFVYNDGVTENETRKLRNGDILSYPATPNRSGYLFAGWYTDIGLTNRYTFSGQITENMTLYAKWIDPAHTYDGVITAGSATTVSLNGSTIRYYAFVPEVSGRYTFVSLGSISTYGYLYNASRNSLTSNSGSPDFRIEYNLTAGQLYYVGVKARYSYTSGATTLQVVGPTMSGRHATVTNAIGGSFYEYNPEHDVDFSFTYDQSYALPFVSRPGYTFTGWYYGDQLILASPWNIDSNATLTARWEAMTHTITLNPDGGAVDYSTVSATYDKAYTLPTPTKTGYTFLGWYDGDTKYESGSIWKNLENLTLTAKWQANSYTVTLQQTHRVPVNVTYEYCDGVTEPRVVTLAHNEVLTYPEVPTRDGYLFAGWYTDEYLNCYYDFEGEIDRDMTLYAKWIQPGHAYVSEIRPGVEYAASGEGTLLYYAFIPNTSGNVTIHFTTNSGNRLYAYLYDGDSSGTQLTNTSGYYNVTLTYSVTAGDLYYIAFRTTSSSLVTITAGETMVSTVIADLPYSYADGTETLDVIFDQEFILPTPVRPGYTFGGWYRGDDQMTSGIWGTASDVVLSPLWIANEYTLTLDADNGTDISTETVTYDNTFILPEPVKTGYTFLGWYDADTRYESGVWNYEANISLTAKWQANSYTVTLQDTKQETVTVTYVYNDEVTENASFTLGHLDQLAYTAPQRAGYLFAGWYTDEDLTQHYGFSGNITEDMTLYAKWIEFSGEVLVVDSSISVALQNQTVLTYAFVPTVSGEYTFTSIGSADTCGYLYDASMNQLVYNDDDGNDNNFLISYHLTAGQLYYVGIRAYGNSIATVQLSATGPALNGSFATVWLGSSWGYEADHSTSIDVTFDQAFALPTFTRPGYTFGGWFNGEEQVISGTWNTTSDMILTPLWIANNYVIMLDANGGEVSEGTLSVYYDQAFELPTPVKEGYTFLGWYDGDTRYESGVWTTTSDVNLTARWEVTQYTIDYDLAGGTNAPANPETYDSFTEIVLQAPTRTGYTFLGWTYEGQETPVMDVTIVQGSSGERSYTANWQVNTYYVTFDANGGEVSTTEGEYTFDVVYELPVPVLTGYTFDGWYYDGVKYESGAWAGAQDMTLTAQWTPNTYNLNFSDTKREDVTVTFEYNDGVTESSSLTLGHGDALSYPTKPEREGYVFAGWFTDAELTEYYSFDGELTRDMTLYAKWIVLPSTDSEWIEPGHSMTPYVNSYTNYDYAFVSQFSGEITVSMSRYTGYGNYIYLYLLDDELNTLTSRSSTRYGSSFTYTVTAGELYYVRIYSYYASDVTITVSGASVEGNSASVVIPAEYEAGQTLTETVSYDQAFTLPTPVRPGYTFLGWFHGEDQVTDGTWTLLSGLTLTPSWQVNSYHLALDANGGEVAQTDFDITFDTAWELPTPTRTGYTFCGWFDGETQYTGGTWTYANDLNLVAVWTANTDISYQVNHYKENLNDDEYVLEQTLNLTGTADEEITPEVNSYEGFDSPVAQTVTIAPDGSLVVNYYYTRPRIIANVITNVGNEVIEQDLKIGAVLDIPEPTREGYTFGGWYTDADLTQELTGSVVGTEGFTVYVWWAEDNKPADFTYSSNEAGEITIESYVGTDTEVVVPAGIGGNSVVAIAQQAFANNASITSLVIPETVTSIAPGALSGCAGLTSLEIPVIIELTPIVQNDSVYPWTVDADTGTLTSTNQTHNSSSTFTYVASEAITLTLEYSVSSENNFDWLTIHKNDTQLVHVSGSYTNVELSVDLEAGDTLTFTYSKDGSAEAGSDCAIIHIRDFRIPVPHVFTELFGQTEGEGLTAVEQGTSTYYVPAGLTEVTYTGHIVPNGAFENFAMLETVHTPNATRIGENAFKGCVALSYFNSNTEGMFVIPEGVIQIARYAFQNVALMTELVVADTVTQIGEGAFNGCNSLTDVTLPFVGQSANSGVFGYIFGTTGTETATDQSTGIYYIPTTIRNVTITVQTVIPTNAFRNCSFIESITIPEATTSIGSYAFYDCSMLTRFNSTEDGTFNMPASVETINSRAFRGCLEMRKLILGENLTSIGSYAYYGAFNLTEVILAENSALTTIGDYAFSGRAGLAKFNSDIEGKFVIPEGVTTIGRYAFQNVALMTELVVANSVTQISTGAFHGCNALTDVTLPFVGTSASGGTFGMIFGTSNSGISYTNQNGSNYYIPDTIRNVTITVQTAVPANAFQNCSFIESITIPEETETIGRYAFSGCTALKTLNSTEEGTFNVPAGVVEIGNRAFYGCSELRKLMLGENLTTIGDYAFYEASGLTEVVLAENSVLQSIGANAFAGCAALSKFNSTEEGTFNVPAGVVEIGNRAFYGCSELRKLMLGENLTTIGDYAFYEASGLTEVVLAENSVLQSIGANAFAGCAALSKFNSTEQNTFIIPDTVTSVGEGVFNGCNLVENITLPFVGSDSSEASGTFGYIFGGSYIDASMSTTQNGYVYYIPYSIRNVTITTQTAIPVHAFQNCSFIESITIPEETASIGQYAFGHCTALKTLNSTEEGVFNIPTGVTEIHECTFYECTQMTSFTCGDLERIGSYAFQNCTSLTTAYLPESLTYLGNNAFDGCTALEEVTFGQGLTTINSNTFSNCTSLSKINASTANTAVIPDTVTEIHSGAFQSCSAIHHWTLPFVGYMNSDSTAASHEHVFGYIFGTDGSASEVYQYDIYFRIPATIRSVTITSQTVIPAYAFVNCNFIESITIPDQTTVIGMHAFHQCNALKRLNSAEDGVFDIPSQVTEIGEYAFTACNGMTELTGGENLKTIGANAFQNCSELKAITLGTQLTSISNYAFASCSKLEQVNDSQAGTLALPYGLITIGTEAFRDNLAITKLVVPESVTSIGQGAFRGCSALTEVSVPFIGASRTATNVSATFGYIFGYTYTLGVIEGTTVQYNSYYKYYIPTTIRTVSVTNQYALPAYAFHNCDFITTINLLQGASNHGTNAFYQCSATVNASLTPVVAPAWNGSDVASTYQSGTGTEDDPYVILNGAQLAYFAQQVNAGNTYEGTYFVLGGDILLGDYAITTIGASSTTPFKGTFDGNGYVIRDFTITSNNTAVALFGYMEGTVKHLGIIDATVTANKSATGDTYVAILVAHNSGTVENCYATNSSLIASCSYAVYAGGLVGVNEGTVQNSFANVTVNANSSNYRAYAGGVVGQNTSEGTVRDCVAYGNVTAKGYNLATSFVGGVVGIDAGTLEDCYRIDTQVITRYTSADSTNELGTQATLMEIREYCITAWDSDVWNTSPNVPIFQ